MSEPNEVKPITPATLVGLLVFVGTVVLAHILGGAPAWLTVLVAGTLAAVLLLIVGNAGVHRG